MRVAVLLMLLALVADMASAQSTGPVKIRPDDGSPDDFFGCAVDVDATVILGGSFTAAVGAVNDDDGGPDAGLVFVYTRFPDAPGWRLVSKLVPDDLPPGSQLGYAVAVDGRWLVAGAPRAGFSGTDSGAVWRFEPVDDPDGVEGIRWVPTGRLAPTGLSAFDQFGFAVDVSGGIYAVGAPGDDTAGRAAGAVWMFEGGGAQRLTVPGSPGAALGSSVALDGQTLVAGAPFDDTVRPSAGAVRVWERTATGWTPTATLLPPSDGGGQFGSSVAVAGNRIAVGARSEDAAGRDSGAVYVFRRTAAGWLQEARLVPGNLAAGDELGVSVDLLPGLLVAGARFASVNGVATGAAYRYELAGGVWRLQERLTDPGGAAGDELGFAVAAARLRDEDLVLSGSYRADVAGRDSGQVCAETTRDDPPPTARSDLRIGKRVVAAGAPGEPVTYRIEVENVGLDPGTLTAVIDRFPSPLTDCRWTCAGSGGALCPSSAGRGDLVETPANPLALAPGAGLVYIARCTVPANLTAPVKLVNTATLTGDRVTRAAATATVTVAPRPDISVTKTATAEVVRIGGSLTYTVTVANAGRAAAEVAILDELPSGLTCSWTCSGTGGASCPSTTSGEPATEIAEPAVELPAAAFPDIPAAVTYRVSCTVLAPVGTLVSNTVLVTDDRGATRTATELVRVVGAAGLPTIPTVSEWGLLALVLALAGLGGLRLRS